MPGYDFKTLSPADFELLVRDLLAAEHGWILEAFGHGQDGGVDLRGRVDGKKIIVQCKHYAGSTFADLRTAARDEMPKMDLEKPDRYLFATSQNLSRTQKDTLAEDLSAWLADPGDLLIQLDLNELLGRHPEVERRHFKLWLASTGILERIVHSGIWARSEALLEDITDRVKLYVWNPGYERAAKQLDDNHVVVLTGAPGVGKSMLAEMLLLNHWHNGWQVISVSSDIEEAWNMHRPGERQIYFYDDFLGQTDISERGTRNEDNRLVRFMERVARDGSKRLVMTTRSQILRQAAFTREPIRRGGFELRECIVELADYGPMERALILYNHLYFSALPRQVIRDYVTGQHYWQVVDHLNFSPRIVEQVLKRDCRSATDLASNLVSTLDRPVELWGTMFATVLSEVAQRIVLTLVTFPPEGISPDTLRQASQQESSPIGYTHALRALEDTFVKVSQRTYLRAGQWKAASDSFICYANPSIRDFVLATLDEEPDYGLALIEEARSLFQILNVLRYAASLGAGHYKFPRLAAAVTARQSAVASRIEALAAETLQISDRYAINSAVVWPLAALLAPAHALMPNESVAMLDRLMQLISQIETGVLGAGSLEHLVEGLLRHINEGAGIVAEDGFGNLLQAWGRALSELDEVDRFATFIEANTAVIGLYVDPAAFLAEHGEVALIKEIGHMLLNRSSQEQDEQWLDEVEVLAGRIGIADRLQSAIDDERRSILEHYVETETEDPMPTSGAGYFAPSQPSAPDQTRSNIGAIFRHLS